MSRTIKIPLPEYLSVNDVLPENKTIEIYNYQSVITVTGCKKKPFISKTRDEEVEIDGQHRYTAAKELKLPVYYYISKGANLRTVQVLNSNSKDWKVEDYMESYITQGIKDYKIYKEFFESYRFNHKVSLMLLLNADYSSMDHLKLFANGDFRIKNMDKAVAIASKICQCEPFYAGYRRRNFIFALIKCLKVKGFSFDEFLNKLRFQSRKMVDCSNVDQYIDLIEEIYNFKRNRDQRLILRAA